jgi:hypothetical protein
MARLQAISQQFRVARLSTHEATQRAIVALAKREHAKVMAADPRPGGFTRYVDGMRGAREEAVKPNGVIVYEYQRLDLVVQFAMETLYDKSPVLSGAYRTGHTIFLDGQPVPNLAGWKPGDDVAISNYLPYSRKIEMGKMKMRVPGTDHVYQQAAQIVNARYGNVARVRFTYRAVVAGAHVPYAPVGTPNAHASRRGGEEQRNRFPALVITER